MRTLFNFANKCRQKIWHESSARGYYHARYKWRTFVGLTRGIWSSLLGRVRYLDKYRPLILGSNIDFDMWSNSAIQLISCSAEELTDPNNQIYPLATSVGVLPHYDHINISMSHPTRLRIRDNASLTLSPNTSILLGCYIAIWPNKNITIGPNSYIAHGVTINIKSGLTIGKNVMIGHLSTIMDYDGHPIFYSIEDSKEYNGDLYGGQSRSITIEDDVWIGFNTTILKGVRIGRGSIVGANSCVTSDIPPNSIAVGNPAKVIKENIRWKKY